MKPMPLPSCTVVKPGMLENFISRPETKDNTELFCDLREMYWALNDIAWEMAENINYNRHINGG